jgi:hypothetical protein
MPEDEMNDPFDDLYGKPFLLEGEDEERYQRLRDAVIRDLKPNDVFEWIAVNRANAQKSTGPKTLAGKLKSIR